MDAIDAFEPFLESVNGTEMNGARLCSGLTVANMAMTVGVVVEK